MHKTKIFGVGFHKTGTSSLAAALRILGYNTLHGDGRRPNSSRDEGRTMVRQIQAGIYDFPTLAEYDAFTDNPYFSIWKHLAERFPDAKFILTERDEAQWLRSCVRYYKGRRVRPMREWMFGEDADPSSSERAAEAWLAAYQKHNQTIKAYFSSQPNRLLVLRLMEGDGWHKICPFLGVEKPSQPFPHANKTRSDGLVGKLVRSLARFLPSNR